MPGFFPKAKRLSPHRVRRFVALRGFEPVGKDAGSEWAARARREVSSEKPERPFPGQWPPLSSREVDRRPMRSGQDARAVNDDAGGSGRGDADGGVPPPPPARKEGKRRRARRAYPILAPSVPPPDEEDVRDDGPSLRVEMAKSAFLRHPCRKRWKDLVHCFRVQNVEPLQRLEEEDEEDSEGGTGDWANNEDMSWENFDDETTGWNDVDDFSGWYGGSELDDSRNGTESAEFGPAPARLEERMLALEDEADGFPDSCSNDRKSGEEDREEEVEIEQALAHLEASIVSLEEKAMLLWGSTPTSLIERFHTKY